MEGFTHTFRHRSSAQMSTMKASLILFAVALATAQQQFNQRLEFTPAVRLASPGFFQQGRFFSSSSSRSSSASGSFRNQNNNIQSAPFGSDRNSDGASQSFQPGSSSFSGNQQNRGTPFDSRNQNQLQNNQAQASSDRENPRNRIALVDTIRVTPARFQSSSGQQPSGIALLNAGNQLQQSNLNQRNSEGNVLPNDNNGVSTGSQSQSSAQFRSSSSSSQLSEEFRGVFEPLNLPSGASAILGSISTSFSCIERPYGYYADQDNSCRVFHICNPYLFSDGEVWTYQYSFMCNEGSIFDQDKMACKAEYEATPCQEAHNFYFRNEEFGLPEERSF
ncbi:protein rtoA-like [Macrobrachium rosenbergii]|uniref:protein rtoA-like n=1 Tax=Macrobrachium rosenbergii TaxID=79674 RepID=UPI0034D4C3CB